MTELSYHLTTLTDLPGVSQQFLNDFKGKKTFAFDGQMGVGKTTFINALLNATGIESTEGSPTYSIVNVYDSPAYGRIYHFDVYRLKNYSEALDFGMEEMLYSGNICFIEWAEKIEEILPDNTIWVYIRKNEDNTRTITVKE
jgi:tRNA threonylcarbamoyladenosine biosynthesis protein TsaE